ncbi:MAG: ATP-binding protein [Proteobacteria bacterium]|nr:ATP-binding protein [Pseudomonadota bacterium]
MSTERHDLEPFSHRPSIVSDAAPWIDNDRCGRQPALDRDGRDRVALGSELRRLLVVDDNERIHRDIRKILAYRSAADNEVDALEEVLFGRGSTAQSSRPFEIDSAYQGRQGLEFVRCAAEQGQPYTLAFIDVRMPPGWDGIETTEHILRADPNIQVVICTAYSDYSWEQLSAKLGQSDRFLVLKKPFDNVEVRQLACALTEKWELLHQKQRLLNDLESEVRLRTQELEQANHKLEQANHELRHEMEERLRVERELRHSQKLEALGRLTAGISHEINNPLSYVLGNLDFGRRRLAEVRGGLAGECVVELREVVEEAFEGAERIRRVIRDVRAFAHPDEGRKAAVDLRKALQGAIKIVGNEIHHRARLVEEYGDVARVAADQQRVEQVFINLLLNAVQALPEGGAGNLIRVSTRASSNHMVAVEIRDTGHGIPSEIADRVFDPFFTTRAVGEGTGLGLSICRSIIEGFDGQLVLDSSASGGTIARVTLPVFEPDGGRDEDVSGRRDVVALRAPGGGAKPFPPEQAVYAIETQLAALRGGARPEPSD